MTTETEIVDHKYTVQILVVREVEVEELDELQAERAAFKKLKPGEQSDAIAMLVSEPDKDFGSSKGALNQDNVKAWRYATEHFCPIDKGWVSD